MKGISLRNTLTYLFIISSWWLLGCQKPPLAALDNAKAAVDSAAKAGAVRYAEAPYREAEKLVQAGWMELAHQKGRLAPFRNFHLADSLLIRALGKASEASRLAKERQLELEIQALTRVSELRTELMNWREAMNGSLVLFKAEHYWTAAELSLRMADRLVEEGEFEEALEAVTKGRASLQQMGQVLTEYNHEEADKLKHWRNWVQETLTESRAAGTHAVIVDKSAHKTYLVKAGILIRTYDCELGYNSARQKLFQGDGATPEGKYQIVLERPRGSKYYKALLLNFPNAMDQRRFQDNKAKGVISRHARIGKNIEIHGDGGRGQDWTEGCVALTNKDLDHLMRYVGAGTPVTIVRRSDQWP